MAERIGSVGLQRLEPHIAGLDALWIPSTGIVDYMAVASAMAKIIRAAGAELQFGIEILAIRERPDAVEIASAQRSWRARTLIACGGLQSDRLAKMAGLKINHRIVPFRGEFYVLPKSRQGLISRLIYPIPDPRLPFVGIHLTRTIDGNILVGPNAVLGFSREGYQKFTFRPLDVADYVMFPGFWRMIANHSGSAIDEIWNSLWKPGYLAQCRKYCPELTLADLEPGAAGIRAQAVLRDGTPVHDFLILESARMLHVCNAPSPAATSAIPIGRMIADKALLRFSQP